MFVEVIKYGDSYQEKTRVSVANILFYNKTSSQLETVIDTSLRDGKYLYAVQTEEEVDQLIQNTKHS